jgi:hypothetical protein
MPVHGGTAVHEEDFVVNTAAERTVMTRATFDALKLGPFYLPTPGYSSPSDPPGLVSVILRIELLSPTDPPYPVPGIIYAAIDPATLTENVLGLDILRQFHVIVSHQRGEVLLLDGAHAYHLTGPP